MVKQGDSHRYSVRASITLWIAIAGFIWVTLGLALTYAAHWGQNSLEADASRLSTIAPAAGPATSSEGN
jgi:hypothetical protein